MIQTSETSAKCQSQPSASANLLGSRCCAEFSFQVALGAGRLSLLLGIRVLCVAGDPVPALQISRWWPRPSWKDLDSDLSSTLTSSFCQVPMDILFQVWSYWQSSPNFALASWRKHNEINETHSQDPTNDGRQSVRSVFPHRGERFLLPSNKGCAWDSSEVVVGLRLPFGSLFAGMLNILHQKSKEQSDLGRLNNNLDMLNNQHMDPATEQVLVQAVPNRGF